MRRIGILIAAMLVVSHAPAFDDALPGVPISQEHHHHLVVENEYVKAYEVELPPHESTLMHQHLHDYIYVVLGDADITNAVAGKPEVHAKLPDLSVNYSPGPFAHIATNNADRPFRNITIELEHPQGAVKNFYSSIREALSGGPNGERDLGVETVLETEEVRVLAVGVRPKSSWSPPRDDRNRLVIALDRIHDTSAPRQKNSPFPAGMLSWVPAGKVWTFSNPALGVDKLMVVEFKASAAK